MSTNGWLRSLFLRGHLRVGIAPRAQLQAAADPAQAFGGVGSAFFAAHTAAGALLYTVRLNCPLGFFNQSLRNDRNLRIGHRDYWAFASHTSTITVDGRRCNIAGGASQA